MSICIRNISSRIGGSTPWTQRVDEEFDVARLKAPGGRQGLKRISLFIIEPLLT
jgi:hypothetical protein